ncbi:uncharacterized protein NP_1960A [Natronomonas pharaonis DSM 2160]|uniref:Uncharacterized protein n=1 Tax=Natronomonas pharaonis (strain ATCC 35678 / DSM 2160 / CIP 103997 / JCM 8858 / NBRC 14720 / NCIMB 2260 / Gabara) TaxID=348780 RepID=A0A1U7EVM2_NATPD|nr:uncharacterized protein NP_1960A [Natronomonas pharaonis DSM 2160]
MTGNACRCDGPPIRQTDESRHLRQQRNTGVGPIFPRLAAVIASALVAEYDPANNSPFAKLICARSQRGWASG